MIAGLLDRVLGREAAPEADAEPPRAAEPEAARHVVQAAIATKLLEAWVQNRQQVRVPLTLNLARMQAGQRGLVLELMRASLAACGTAPGTAEERLAAAVRRAGGEGEVPGPGRDLPALMAGIEAAGIGPNAYAAAALVLDRQRAVERIFLDWLAARFALPPELTAGLARRYRGLR